MKDVREIVSKPRKVALYASMTMDDYYAVCDVTYVDYDEHFVSLPKGELREYPRQGYVRISDVIEVNFTPVDSKEIVAKAVESLNEEERKVIDELNRKIAGIREKKSQLLALTHQVAS